MTLKIYSFFKKTMKVIFYHYYPSWEVAYPSWMVAIFMGGASSGGVRLLVGIEEDGHLLVKPLNLPTRCDATIRFRVTFL
jgi:hypothetical protein